MEIQLWQLIGLAVINGIFGGFANAVGVYYANKHFIEGMKKIVSKIKNGGRR